MIPFVETDHPIASESPDHLFPMGTRTDSSRNPRFVDKLGRFPRAVEPDFAVLDLGCAGGGFVKDCLDRGWQAVGLEGSDYCKMRKRFEWATIPGSLFTCDITKPFTVMDSAGAHAPRQICFDIVTTWEVLEHIAEPDLPQLADNVRRHLRPDGLFVVSIRPFGGEILGVEHHQTVQPQPWWEATFRNLGLYVQPSFFTYFGGQYVRGPKFRGHGSFNLVLSRCNPHPLAPPVRGWRGVMLDKWHGSAAQRLLKTLVLGSQS